MTTIPKPQTTEEANALLKQFNGMLRMYSDNGWGAHWELIEANTGKILIWMNEMPEFDDTPVKAKMQELHDTAVKMSELRIELMDTIKLWQSDSE